MAFRYSITLDILAMAGYDVLERPREVLKEVGRAGYDGVDVPGNPERVNPKEMREIAASLGLKIPAVLGAWATWHAGEERNLASPEEETTSKAIRYSMKCIDLAVEVGAQILELCATPKQFEYPVSKIPVKVLRQNFVKSVREVCRYAATRDITIVVEPINRFEGFPGFLNNFDDALSVIDEVGASNLGILADLFHMNIEDVSICESIRAAGKRLRHIHLADSNRLAPGCGHLDFKAILRALEEMGFTGYLSMDCVPVKPDVRTFLERSLGYMKEMEKAVELQRQVYAMDIPAPGSG